MSTLILRSTRVVTPAGVRPAAIEVRHGRIAAVHAHDAVPAGLAVHEAHDAVIAPGLVDSHVHVNEPGRSEWEGFATATAAAAAGGVTTIADMPLNSIPATVSRRALGSKRAAAQGQCAVDVAFLGGVIPGPAFEWQGLHESGVVGFKCFMVPSGVDEFPPVSEADLERALPALARLNSTLMVHAEWPGLLLDPPLSARRFEDWAASRPAAAEERAIEVVAALAERHGAAVHIVHVSSAEGCRAVAAAQARGVRMTAETCPHYLTFTANEVPEGATVFKCAPPLRTAADRDALWAALAHGTLSQVVSDHSPCPPALKALESGDFALAWGGIASLQHGLPVVWTAARARGVPFERVLHWMSSAPAALLGLGARKGAIAPGRDADFVVWTPESTFTVDAAALLQRHALTPYLGRTLSGVVHATYLAGTRIYTPGTGVTSRLGRLLYREVAFA